MNSKAAAAEKFLALVLLSAYPVLVLVMRGSMSALFFCMAALSVVSLLRIRAWQDNRLYDAGTIAFAIAMASASFVILPAQIVHHEISWRPYDEAVRLLLAIPIYLAVRLGKWHVTPILALSMPAGAILAAIVVGGDANSLVNGRLGPNFLNLIHFGDLALMLGFLSLISIHANAEKSVIFLVVKLCGLLAGVYLSFRSGTRGGWLAVPLFLLIWLMLGIRLNSRIRFVMAIALVGVLALATVFAYDIIQHRVLEIKSDLAAFERGNKDTSVGIRIQLLQVVAHVLLENPLFGAGLQGFKATLITLAQSGTITAEAVQLGNAEVHNQILSYAVKYGVPGLISGLAIHWVPLAIFVHALKTAEGTARTAALMGICLTTGFFVFGLTVEILNLKHTVAFYSMTLAVLMGEATRGNTPDTLIASRR